MKDTIIIYTDGACHKNPGPGGWGVVLKFNEKEKQLYGGEVDTTNNRMELLAAIRAFQALKRPCIVKLHSDSQYVIKGMSEWIHNWKMKAWKDVKNPDLWQQLDEVSSIHKVDWIWVKGHNGDYYNELADKLANEGVKMVKKFDK